MFVLCPSLQLLFSLSTFEHGQEFEIPPLLAKIKKIIIFHQFRAKFHWKRTISRFDR